jgi:hypothetical protein
MPDRNIPDFWTGYAALTTAAMSFVGPGWAMGLATGFVVIILLGRATDKQLQRRAP